MGGSGKVKCWQRLGQQHNCRHSHDIETESEQLSLWVSVARFAVTISISVSNSNSIRVSVTVCDTFDVNVAICISTAITSIIISIISNAACLGISIPSSIILKVDVNDIVIINLSSNVCCQNNQLVSF